NTSAREEIAEYPVEPRNVGRPEMGGGPRCIRGADGKTSVLAPSQMLEEHSSRIVKALKVSAVLDTIISNVQTKVGNKGFEQVVQVYFISPDSLLRLWSSRNENICTEFDPARLWAAKSYFTYFWDHAQKKDHWTGIYIDYGGNGLVQTRCRSLE